MIFYFKLKSNIIALFVALLVLSGCTEFIVFNLGYAAVEILNDTKKSKKEKSVQKATNKNNIEAYSSGGLCAENGSCYGDISNLTGNSKTVHVSGYYRSDGTYVRGHYRSK